MGEKTEKKTGKTDAMRRAREEAYARKTAGGEKTPLELGETPKPSGKGGKPAAPRRGPKG